MEHFIQDREPTDDVFDLLDVLRETQRYTDEDGLEQARLAEERIFQIWKEEALLGDPDMFIQTGKFN